MAAIRFKRGTRAQLDAAAAASQLAAGEPYTITDEGGMALGLGASTYMDLEGAMKTWVSGMSVKKHQKVISPADNEEYRRITATGSGTTDPADDVTNYVARSYERTAAIPWAGIVTNAGTSFGVICLGSTKTALPAISVGVRTSVLSVSGRGCVDYLVFFKGAVGTTRVEMLVDGRSILDQTDTYNTANALLALGMQDTGSGATTMGAARFDPNGVEFRRSLEVWVTNTATASTTAAGIAYHLRSVA